MFKVERGAAYVRMHAGALHVRERFGDDKITAIEVFEPGGAVARDALHAGQIGKVSGLRVRIGDTLGAGATDDGRLFAPPTLETVVEAEDRVALHRALTELAEQDPLIDLRLDGDELAVSLYGEVQKEVIATTLATEYGLEAGFRETTTIRLGTKPAGRARRCS